MYRPWLSLVTDDVEVWAAQLPGRESRLSERPVRELEEIVAALRGALPVAPALPFVFFGHSMGALLAFELARSLRSAGEPEPAHLFVSGSRAPQLPRRAPDRRALADDEFREELRRLNGTPPEMLEHAELMELMLPILRADFTVCDSYEFTAGPSLTCLVTGLAGAQDDEALPHEYGAWAEVTSGAFSLHVLPGDHFFVNSERRAVVEIVCERLAGIGEPARRDGTTRAATRERTP